MGGVLLDVVLSHVLLICIPKSPHHASIMTQLLKIEQCSWKAENVRSCPEKFIYYHTFNNFWANNIVLWRSWRSHTNTPTSSPANTKSRTWEEWMLDDHIFLKRKLLDTIIQKMFSGIIDCCTKQVSYYQYMGCDILYYLHKQPHEALVWNFIEQW